MSNLGQELYEIAYRIGYEEERKKEHVRIVKNLMKSQNWTALQALNAVNTPEEKIPEYLALLEEKN